MTTIELDYDKLADCLVKAFHKAKDSEPLLTIEELSNHTGIPVKTIYNWNYQHHDLPHYGKRNMKFKLSEFEKWLKDKR